MTSVAELFHHADVPYAGAIRWGGTVPLDAPGVYVVSTSADARQSNGPLDCPLDHAAMDALLSARPEATVDSVPATPALLASRLREMWPAGESVVYIGLAGTNTQHRVHQFYGTSIGARAPHAGGWPVKMLEPNSLWVHFGPTDDPGTAESAMVRYFAAHLPDAVTRELVDPDAALPFANLTFPRGRRKAHGLSGVKEARTATRIASTTRAPTPAPADELEAATPTSGDDVGQVRFTQNVTPSDMRTGILRVPRASKSIFPTSTAQIEIELRGQAHLASWNPRTAGGKERSGVIGVGKAVLASRVIAGDSLQIETTPSGYRIF